MPGSAASLTFESAVTSGRESAQRAVGDVNMDKHRPKPEAAQDRPSQRYPWPDSQPEGYLALSRWFLIDNQIGLSELLKPGDVVIELGSWLGESTRFMCDSVFPNGHVYAVDHWQGVSASLS